MKSPLTRRTFLRSAGAASLALPALPSLLSRRAEAQLSEAQRLLVITMPNGSGQRSGEGGVPDHIGEIFAPFSSRMTSITNLDNSDIAGGFYRHLSHPHNNAFSALYGGQGYAVGSEPKTFDQFIATEGRNALSGAPSLAINLFPSTGEWAGALAQQFNVMSWRGARQPIEPYVNPRVLFENFFTDLPTGMRMPAERDPEEDGRLMRRGLLLDQFVGQAADLRRSLGRDDQLRLDEYLTGVEELDVKTRALLEMPAATGASCTAPDAPNSGLGSGIASPSQYPEFMGLMQDLTVRALQCDLTRVATFIHHIGGGRAWLTHPFISGMEGSLSDWHVLSHWGDSSETRASSSSEQNRRDYLRLVTWHNQQVAGFLQKLEDAPGALGGSVLDETLVSVGSELSYGVHHTRNLYQLFFGSGGGAFREGASVDAGGASCANLWLSVMHGFGVDASSYGVSTGEVSGVLA